METDLPFVCLTGSLLSAQSVSQIHNAVEDAIRTVITFLLSVAMSEEADKACFVCHFDCCILSSILFV